MDEITERVNRKKNYIKKKMNYIKNLKAAEIGILEEAMEDIEELCAMRNSDKKGDNNE